jgi:hypothetical protein
VFYFENSRCPKVTLSKHNAVASISGRHYDAVLLAHRGITSGNHTFAVHIEGEENALLAQFFSAFIRATIGVTYDSITETGNSLHTKNEE